MTRHSRRDVLKTLGAAIVAGAVPVRAQSAQSPPAVAPFSLPFDLGLASYSLRAFALDAALDMTARLGVQNLTLKDMHLPLNSTAADIESLQKAVSARGLSLVSAGVVYMKSEAEVRNAFTLAKMARLKFIVGVPDPPLLKFAEEQVKETGIGLAVHNHGPGDERYPTPESAYTRLAGMDKRMGLCIDVGHTARSGLDPATEFERFADRVLDLHVKDVSSSDAKGTTVEIGRGVIDIPRLLGILIRLRYHGTLHFEFEKDEKDPLPGLAESIGYVRGALAGMRPHAREESR